MSTLFIAGQWRDTPTRVEVHNPYDNTLVGTVSAASAAEVGEATRALAAAVCELTAFERGAILERTAAAIEAEAEAFEGSIVAESGLCRKDARKEVGRACAVLRTHAQEAVRITGESLPTDVTARKDNRLAVTCWEPVGVVAAITPFNRPLNQVVVKLAPAIAAGCRVVVKPSEKTPLTAVKLVQTLLECGLPPEMIALLTGPPATIGPALVRDPLVNLVTFTGSTAVGQAIAREAGMIRVCLELGDSGALIVMPSADLDAAAAAAVAGAFATAGQSCRGVKRILAHRSIAAELGERLAELSKGLCVGDPAELTTDIGCLINESAAIEVEQRVTDAIARGATALTPRERRGAQLRPVVLTDVPRDCPLVAQETFGPVAPIIAVADLDDAIACVNHSPHGLQTGIFTARLDEAMVAFRRLQTGAVIVNGGPNYESPNLPFGGVKGSGLGREGARYAIREMSVLKTLVL